MSFLISTYGYDSMTLELLLIFNTGLEAIIREVIKMFDKLSLQIAGNNKKMKLNYSQRMNLTNNFLFIQTNAA